MPTPRPIIATIAIVKSGIATTWLSEADERRGDAEAEQGGADRQAHREHRAEGEDQDDDGGDDAEQLALGQLELGEQVAAVLDLHARWGLLFVAEVLDLLAEVLDVGEAAVADRQRGEGDLPFCADLWPGSGPGCTTVTPCCSAAKSAIAFISACAAGSLA